MGESIHQGRCEGCGKVYRVSDAATVSTCLSCGGALRVGARSSVAPRRPAPRRRSSRTARVAWIALAVLIAAVGAAYGLHLVA